MIEVRPIRENEAEPFLHVLCDVFGLDFNRAYDVFFQEPYFDLERKWALVEGQQLVSILTVVPVEFGWGKGIGIAGVATQKNRQNEGYASTLLNKVLKEYEKRDEGAALLFARETKLYEKAGFELIDRVVRAPLKANDEPLSAEVMSIAEIQARYTEWSDAHPDRLRRDESRWRYWRWQYRTCSPFRDGYLCNEVPVLREAIFSGSVETLPVPAGTDWLGTTFMADQLEILLENPEVDLYLMARNAPGIPQLFMTDQF